LPLCPACMRANSVYPLTHTHHDTCVVARVSFIQGDGHHRDLHSFPTRRSSDLRSSRPRPTARPHSICLTLVSSPRPPTASDRSRDRKSTRLNSSHLGISYAVFCLKKKKTRST